MAVDRDVVAVREIFRHGRDRPRHAHVVGNVRALAGHCAREGIIRRPAPSMAALLKLALGALVGFPVAFAAGLAAAGVVMRIRALAEPR